MTSPEPLLIFSVGHSNHAREFFVSLLKKHGIQRLVDVRARPVSRFAPWSNQKALRNSLAQDGIEYVYLGQLLGGRPGGALPKRALTCEDFKDRRNSPGFKEGVRVLIELARETRTAMMCAEEDPARCHRKLLITPALLEQGAKVVHIRKDGREEPDPGPDEVQGELF